MRRLFTGRPRWPRGSRALAAISGCTLLALIGATPTPALAHAKTEVAYWSLSSSDVPTNLPPGGTGEIVATASNLGDAVLSGQKVPLKVTDTLPAGLTPLKISGHLAAQTSVTLECTPKPATEPLWCKAPYALPPSSGIKVGITVAVNSTLASGTVLQNEVAAEGGEIPAAAPVKQNVTISAAPTSFGIEKYALTPENEGGTIDTEAGTHPFQLTTSIGLNETAAEEPAALPRNLQFNLPAGLLGNPLAIPQCSGVDFAAVIEGPANLCPADTAVGLAEVTLDEPDVFTQGPTTLTVPVFNLEPAPGEPARFGISAYKVPVVLDTAIRTGSDYGVVVTAENTSQSAGLIASKVTIWGVPGDSRHNASRGWSCTLGASKPASLPSCNEVKQPAEVPFLSLPTSCETPWTAPMRSQSWAPHAEYGALTESEFPVTLGNCSALTLGASIETTPNITAASTPTELGVAVNVPQNETAEGRAQSAVRTTTVELPQGLDLSPAAAGGLQACSALQVGFLGAEESAQTANTGFSPGPALCPDASKVGTVEITSPDLGKVVPVDAEHPEGIEHDPLKGSIYLASEGTNPFEPPLVLYIVARDPVSGVLVKLAGTVTPDPVTGQQTSVFKDTPQVPFEKLDLKFFGGPKASLTTPPRCGTYTTTSTFVPWSNSAPATPSASFAITSGPGGTPCPNGALPFAPSFSAGAGNVQAGAFAPFSLTIGVPDGNQSMTGLSAHLPEGMAAMLSSITPCPVAVADAAQCGPESAIGHSETATGLGSEPFTLPGTAYLTQGLDGAPFGISVATRALAGPFDLGTIVANSTIQVDPSTAAVTVTAVESLIVDNHGSKRLGTTALPTIVKGVPVQLKALHVSVDRPNFEFNPTSCNATEVTATLAGAEGTSVVRRARPQAFACGALPFGPKLTATAAAVASKKYGANLNINIQSAGFGQASIRKVFLKLPKSLPSRLDTIQKACPQATFSANPATCDEGSVIGKARIRTPVLKSALVGPAYLVSHAGAAFPDVDFVLQGEGITLVLTGKTNIEHGITESRFEAAPDAPFTSFETELPTGPHSALTAYTPATPYNLCKTNLEMPTEIIAQNGTVIRQTTHIAVTGCGGVLSFKVRQERLLNKALKVCRSKFKKNRHKRVACERQARKKYPLSKSKAKSKKKK
jgi:hypothetical protein